MVNHLAWQLFEFIYEATLVELVAEFTDHPVVDVAFKNYVINQVSEQR